MKRKQSSLAVCGLLVWLVSQTVSASQSKLYMQDTPTDTGVEPNPDTGSLSASPDIWTRNSAIPGYQPYPYLTSTPPSWLTALGPNPDQFPLYRDPLYSKPNYIYVRVHNIGDSASAGTEALHLYWAKASTGLSWPAQWVDYVSNSCGPNILYGMEITKPRRNLADPSVPQSEINNYINTISNIATITTYQFPGGIQYWYKQNQVHYFVVEQYNLDPFKAHFSDGFLPWHREFINRYEVLLRKASPTVTLFYWDWTTNPTNSPQSTVYALMGSYHGGITGSSGPFYDTVPLPDDPGDLDGTYPPVSRFTGAGTFNNTYVGNPETTSDSTILSKTSFSTFSAWNEGTTGGSQAHGWSHTFIGGRPPNGGNVYLGNMSGLDYAAQDPFFFLLHANVDRLWSVWQRQNQTRYDPAQAYSGTSLDMTKPMAPWNGYEYNGVSGTQPPTPLRPWDPSDGYITYKAANDSSVVFPPIYDTAPLTIPVLQPGQSVVIEIPWYPPNPEDFSCFGGDQRHVCLLARIETATTYPYGMTFPEGTNGNDLYTNVQNNARIAWKNISVLPANWGALIQGPVWLRNLSSSSQNSQLGLALAGANTGITNFGQVMLDLGPDLFARWLANGAVAQGFQTNGNSTRLTLVGASGILSNLPLAPNEVNQVQVELLLNPGYPNPQGQVFNVDLTQYNFNLPGVPPQVVGGQRFAFDFNRMSFVAPGSSWRFMPTNQLPDPGWNQVAYNDSQWPSGPAKLGFGIGNEATIIDGGPTNSPYVTTWFRYNFTLQNLGIYSNLWLQLKAYDGAVVYLNGAEIKRMGMPPGTITPTTPATQTVSGLATDTFYPLDVSSFLPLLSISNVVAVEVHRSNTNVTDLGFDLELDANLFNTNFPPRVALTSPPNGAPVLSGQPVSLTAAAVTTANPVTSVSYYSDGHLIGSAATPPYTTIWSNAPSGQHSLTVVATDAAGFAGSGFGSVAVVSNIPPSVTIMTPAEGQVFAAGQPVPFTANAGKIGGTIQTVDFYLMQYGPGFMNPMVSLGSAAAPPYQVQFAAPTNGPALLTAVATDNLGTVSYSAPVLIFTAPAANPILALSNAPPFIILNWAPTNAILEQAPSPAGPWQVVSNASSPYGFLPRAGVTQSFFRVYLVAPPRANVDVICGSPTQK